MRYGVTCCVIAISLLLEAIVNHNINYCQSCQGMHFDGRDPASLVALRSRRSTTRQIGKQTSIGNAELGRLARKGHATCTSHLREWTLRKKAHIIDRTSFASAKSERERLDAGVEEL